MYRLVVFSQIKRCLRIWKHIDHLVTTTHRRVCQATCDKRNNRNVCSKLAWKKLLKIQSQVKLLQLTRLLFVMSTNRKNSHSSHPCSQPSSNRFSRSPSNFLCSRYNSYLCSNKPLIFRLERPQFSRKFAESRKRDLNQSHIRKKINRRLCRLSHRHNTSSLFRLYHSRLQQGAVRRLKNAHHAQNCSHSV